MSVLTMQDVTVAYNGEPAVLGGINIDAAAGEHIGLLGPNGSGKTSLLKAVLQLLPLQRGRILLDGRPVQQFDSAERARRMAYLPQGAQVYWPLPVARVVALGATPWRHSWAGDEARLGERVAATLASVDASHLAARPMSALSGGERMLVHLARVLVGEPAIILADEPVANLDPQHQLQVMSVLSAFAASGGTVLTVLHDLTLAARFCSRAILLSKGAVLADGPPDAVLTGEHLGRAYGVEMLLGEHAGQLWVIPWQRQGEGPLSSS